MQYIQYIGIFCLIAVPIFAIFYPGMVISFQCVGMLVVVLGVTAMGGEGGATLAMMLFAIYGLVIFSFQNKRWLSARFWRPTLSEVMLGLMLLYAAYSLQFTTAPDYGADKLKKSIASILFILITARLFSQYLPDIEKMLKASGMAAAAMTTIYMIMYAIGSSAFLYGHGRFTGGFSSPLVLAWTSAACVVFSSYLILKKDHGFMLRVMGLAGCTFGIALIFLSASRGAFFALLLGGFISFFRFKKIAKSTGIIAFIVIALLGGLLFAGDYATERILSVFSEDEQADAGGRLPLFTLGIQMFMESPLTGYGFGAFGEASKGKDIRYYPHNIFIESACELGLIGLSLITMIVGLAIWHLLQWRRRVGQDDAACSTVNWLFIVGFGNAFLSFDMPEQRILFAAIGIAAGVSRALDPRRNELIDYRNHYGSVMHARP